MYAKSIIAVAALAGAVSAAPVGEKQPPKGWWTAGLEPYMTYHTRYLALECYNQHDTDFFKQCCSPLLKDQLLSSRPAECTPSDEATSSVSSSLAAKYAPTATVNGEAQAPSASATDAEWTEEEVCDESSAIAQATATASGAPHATEEAEETTSTSSAAPSPTADAAPAYVAQAEPSPSPEPSTSEAPAYTPSSTTEEAQPTQAPSNGGGDVHSGGYATFFYQNGNPGACGNYNSDSTPLVAIDQAQWYASGSSSFGSQSNLCGKWLTITNTNNGKSVSAIVADVCPTCANGNSLDLSVGAFNAIATESEGQVPISWTWN